METEKVGEKKGGRERGGGREADLEMLTWAGAPLTDKFNSLLFFPGAKPRLHEEFSQYHEAVL